MMFMPGPFEIALLLIIVGLPLLIVVRIIIGTVAGGRSDHRNSKRGGFTLGHAMLNCPHCQQETTVGKPQCERCGKDL